MLTGERKGQDLDITSSSGYLFGAACKPGMKVIVMQSVAGDSTVASVYTQDREGIIYIFAIIYLLALCLIGGKQGIKGSSLERTGASFSYNSEFIDNNTFPVIFCTGITLTYKSIKCKLKI